MTSWIKQNKTKGISFSKSVKRLFLRFSLSFNFSWFVTAGEKSKYSFLSFANLTDLDLGFVNTDFSKAKSRTFFTVVSTHWLFGIFHVHKTLVFLDAVRPVCTAFSIRNTIPETWLQVIAVQVQYAEWHSCQAH